MLSRPAPAPEGTGSAAGAHLVSYYIPEICSENERDLKRQNQLPFFLLCKRIGGTRHLRGLGITVSPIPKHI